MEFIFHRILLCAGGIVLGAHRTRDGRKERSVDNINAVQDINPRAVDEAQAAHEQSATRFTPGQFWKEAGHS